jgi:hypothetical protein
MVAVSVGIRAVLAESLASHEQMTVLPGKPQAVPLALPQRRHFATRKAAQVSVSRQGQEVMASAPPEAALVSLPPVLVARYEMY